jgi:hypothetical protein
MVAASRYLATGARSWRSPCMPRQGRWPSPGTDQTLRCAQIPGLGPGPAPRPVERDEAPCRTGRQDKTPLGRQATRAELRQRFAQLSARVNPELREDLAQMPFDCAGGQEQLGADL